MASGTEGSNPRLLASILAQKDSAIGYDSDDA